MGRVYRNNGGKKVKRTVRYPRKQYKGKGDYKEVWNGVKSAYRTAQDFSRNNIKPFETAGSAIGSKFGPLGGKLGSSLGKWLGSVTGFGSYNMTSKPIVSNTLLGMNVEGAGVGSVPRMSNASDRYIITHREYIGDIYATTAFNSGVYAINPGLKNTFPWLSKIAVNFEQWKPLGMIFVFKSLSGDALSATNTALGNVILATDYNSDNTHYTSKQAMENSEYFSNTKPSCDVAHPIECAANQQPLKMLYVRETIDEVEGSFNFYDLGQFQIATIGSQAQGYVIGELHVAYQIEFFKPILNLESGLEGFKATILPTNVTPAAPFGANNDAINVTHDSIAGSVTLVNFEGAFINFNNGVPNATYVIEYWVNGTAAVGVVAPPIATTNCAAFLMWGQPSAQSRVPVGSSGTTTDLVLTQAIVISPTGGPAIVQLQGGAGPFPTAPVACQVMIYRVPNKINV